MVRTRMPLIMRDLIHILVNVNNGGKILTFRFGVKLSDHTFILKKKRKHLEKG